MIGFVCGRDLWLCSQCNMFYLNLKSEKELIHSSTRVDLGVKVIDTLHVDRVLVLAPHPDDDVFGCGGLLAHMVEHKARLKVLYFSGGAIGNPQGERDINLIAQREQEAVDALHEIGGGTTNFLRGEDLKLGKETKLWEKIYEEMILDKPDLVLIPDAQDWNIDHEVVYSAALIAYRKLRRNKPHVWSYFVWGLNRPSYLFPLDGRLVNIKKAAMSCHKSQLKVKRYDEAILGLNEFLGKGLGLVHPAEGYKEIF